MSVVCQMQGSLRIPAGLPAGRCVSRRSRRGPGRIQKACVIETLGLPEFRMYPLGDTRRKKLCLGHMEERLEAGSGRLGAKLWTGQSRAIQNARGGQWVTMETLEVASGSLWPYSFCCLQYKEWNLEASTHHTSAPPQTWRCNHRSNVALL